MAQNFGNYNSTYKEEVSLAYCLMTYDKKQNDIRTTMEKHWNTHSVNNAKLAEMANLFGMFRD